MSYLIVPISVLNAFGYFLKLLSELAHFNVPHIYILTIYGQYFASAVLFLLYNKITLQNIQILNSSKAIHMHGIIFHFL